MVTFFGDGAPVASRELSADLMSNKSNTLSSKWHENSKYLSILISWNGVLDSTEYAVNLPIISWASLKGTPFKTK